MWLNQKPAKEVSLGPPVPFPICHFPPLGGIHFSMDRVCSPGLRQRLTLEESIFFCSSSSTLSNPIPSSSSKKPERAREIHGEMERNEDIIEEAAAAVAAEEEGMMAEVEKIYVAVSKDVKESKSALNWALQQCRGRKICLLHVHQPATMIPIMGGKFPANKLKNAEVKAYRDLERQKMNKSLNEYSDICSNVGVQVEKLQIELDNIEKGIVELVDQHGIKILVMGAAADKHYFKKMAVLRSKKAIFVCQQAHAQCRIWFVCKGYLILTREAVGTETGTSPSQILIPLTETSHAIGPRSLSEGNYVRLTNPVQDLFQSFQRVKSDGFYTRGGRSAALSSSEETRGTSISQRLSSEGSSSNEYKETATRSPSQGSDSSIWSFGEVVGITDSISVARYEESEEAPHYSAQNEPEERKFIDEMDDQLRQAMAETEDSKREAFEESVRRRKAERYAIEAMSKAKASESLYVNAVKQKKEMEDALARETLSLKEMKTQQDDMMKELRAAQEQKLTLESQLAESNRAVKEMEEKIVSAVELLISFKKQRDEMQLERDNTVKEAEELRRRGESETSNSQRTQFLSEFPFMEIGEATRDFDPSLIIGEGGYGNVFRGMLRNTEVAIKMLHSSSLQGHSEFQQEVNILGRVRHPNLVTLIGTCPEASAIIYEYLPSGSLEDWLVCKNNTAPLSWQTRTRIAIEICSALIFLHSNKPHSIVHGDLKPANVLLDANLVSKLGDFGICRLITFDENSIKTTPFCKTSPKGTFVYMDPEFVSTGELTAKSDVYSFGVILLRLLTGKPAMGLVKEVEYALENGNLGTVLDASAGEWPFVQAKQLAHLALRCCEMNRRNRPDLVSEVWRVLEPLKASYGASPFWLGNEQDYGAPSYFLCPILQEIMQDPLVAADGFTYEAEALKGWLESGHDTSPMTNVKLTHRNLVPNHSLRSAIQEWLQKR